MNLEKVIVPKKLLQIGRYEYEQGNLKASRGKLEEFIEIFSEKYTIVLSHNALDVAHFRKNYNSILKKTPSSDKAYFFEDKFAELSEFFLQIKNLPFKINKFNKPINLILSYNAGVNDNVNLQTESFLNQYGLNFNIFYLPNLCSISEELDKRKMEDFTKTIDNTSNILIFNDLEVLFFAQSYSNDKKLEWQCKHFIELFDVE